MKRLLALLFAFGLLGVSIAYAQNSTSICYTTNGQNCIAVSPTNPLPITSSGGGGGAVTIANGADVTQGAKADSAYGGSGDATVISALKALYNSVTSSIPTGSNVIGGVTIADGSDAVQGAVADAAATAGSTGTLSAKLRLITTQLNTISNNTAIGITGNPIYAAPKTCNGWWSF